MDQFNAYTLTVNGGTGSGPYIPASRVSLTAKMAPSGKSFDKWVITSGNPAISAINSAATTFTMPASDVAVTAAYK